METGKPMVQIGELVRGRILNCMWPIVRDGVTIGYIWSNETVDRVEEQMRPIINRVYGINILIFILIYASVSVSTRFFLDKILRIKRGIEDLINKPSRHIPSVTGELSIIANTINELVDSVSFMKSYNKYILEGVLNGVLAVSMDGKITRANKAFFQMFPEFPELSLGLDFREAFKEEELRDLIDDGLSRDLFYTNREIFLGKKVLEIYSNSITDEDGGRLGAVFVFRDKTVIREYEAALLEKERVAALGEMALGVVHEIKNPLTSVKGFAQLLRHPGVTEEKRLQYIGLIDTELNRVNRLLNEMLVYGGRAEPDLKPEDLLQIVCESAARIDWAKAGVSFRIEPETGPAAASLHEDTAPEEPPVSQYIVLADKYKIMQVFDNILKNAVEAMADCTENRHLAEAAPPEGRARTAAEKNVTARLRASETEVEVSVSDTGCGIDEGIIEKIWTPFFTTKREGTGFGLAICYRIVEAHGGTIQAFSKPGNGTTITVVLPKKTQGGAG